MSTHTGTNIPMQGPRAILTASLVLAGCGSDLTDPAPICDDIGSPLGISPTYAVELVATRTTVEVDGSVRWTYPDGLSSASDGGTGDGPSLSLTAR